MKQEDRHRRGAARPTGVKRTGSSSRDKESSKWGLCSPRPAAGRQRVPICLFPDRIVPNSIWDLQTSCPGSGRPFPKPCSAAHPGTRQTRAVRSVLRSEHGRDWGCRLEMICPQSPGQEWQIPDSGPRLPTSCAHAQPHFPARAGRVTFLKLRNTPARGPCPGPLPSKHTRPSG